MKFLIYGATKGKGSGIAPAVGQLLVSKGHTVRGVCRSKEKSGIECGFPVEALDLASPASVSAFKSILHEMNPDVIWFACGTGYDKVFWELSEEDIEATLDANVRMVVRFCRICAPSCIDGGPQLVLTGSIAGVVDGVGASLYTGTKSFLIPFARAQCRELAQNGKQAKISVLSFNSIQVVGMEAIADALEFIGKRSRPVELLIR